MKRARQSNRRRMVALALAGLGMALAGGCGSSMDGGGGDNEAPSPSGPGNGSSGGGAGSAGGAFDPGLPPGGNPSPSGSGGSSGASGPGAQPPANTNVALGGAQDFGYYRKLLGDGKVPEVKDFDAAGFFAEHHTKLPPPSCGQRVCLQSMLAVMGNLSTGASCTMLQLGLNSTLVADPALRPPLNLTVSVDVSGSMLSNGKIDFVRNGLEQLIDGLRDGDKLALVTYSDVARLVVPMTEVTLRRAELRAVVRGLGANGGTALHDGLQLAYQQALENRDGARQNRVLLLSDGQPTVGITSLDAILQMSRAYNSEGMGLTTIGVGTDFNPVLMRRLSQQADGNYYFLENAGAVNEVFGDELSYFTVPVVYDLSLELAAGSEYSFGRAHGSSFWKDSAPLGGKLEVPSVFLAHRRSHDDQTPQGGRRGGGSALLIELLPRRTADDGSGLTSAQVATVNVRFRDPTSNQIVTDQVVINYPRPPWDTPEEGVFLAAPAAAAMPVSAPADVTIVQKSFVMLNIYTALENTSRAFHAGDRSQILPRLARLRAAVVDYNEEIGDQDIVADLALLDQLVTVLRRHGLSDGASAPSRPNPWAAD